MIRIYTFAVNRPDFLEYQLKTFRHFLVDPQEMQLVVVNDGGNENHALIANKAAELNLECHTVENPRRDSANYAHARAIEYIYDKCIRHDDDISVMLDGDMFLGHPFSIHNWLMAGSGDYQLSALRQSRGHVEYMWPGVVMLWMKKLPDKDKLSFWPDIVDGEGCDVGGHSYEYLRMTPDVRVRWLSHSGQIHVDNNNLDSLPAEILPLYDSNYFIELVGKVFVHYGGGTNWFNKTPEYHATKSAFFFNFLDQLMSGAVSLPIRVG